MAAALAEGDSQPAPAAEGVEAFFEIFVSSLTVHSLPTHPYP